MFGFLLLFGLAYGYRNLVFEKTFVFFASFQVSSVAVVTIGAGSRVPVFTDKALAAMTAMTFTFLGGGIWR
jgi:hypothetical protein